jgi:hypothetical protein
MATKHGLYLTTDDLKLVDELFRNVIDGDECIDCDEHLAEIERIHTAIIKFIDLVEDVNND